MTLKTLKTQLWMGDKLPSSDKMQPVTNDLEGGIVCKPRGGLWTSTHSPEGSDWYRWLTGVGCVRDPNTCKYYLILPEEANILVIDDQKSVQNLFQVYGISSMPWLDPFLEKQGRFSPRSLDFEEIAKTYDAIHLTRNGLFAAKRAPLETRLETRLGSGSFSLRAWDCESVLWLRWKFSKITEITKEMAVNDDA